jgi:hypothetical protein
VSSIYCIRHLADSAPLDPDQYAISFSDPSATFDRKWILLLLGFSLILSPIFICSKKYAANPSAFPETGFRCPYGFSSLIVSSSISLLGDEAIEYDLSTMDSSSLPEDVGRLRGTLKVTY